MSNTVKANKITLVDQSISNSSAAQTKKESFPSLFTDYEEF